MVILWVVIPFFCLHELFFMFKKLLKSPLNVIIPVGDIPVSSAFWMLFRNDPSEKDGKLILINVFPKTLHFIIRNFPSESAYSEVKIKEMFLLISFMAPLLLDVKVDSNASSTLRYCISPLLRWISCRKAMFEDSLLTWWRLYVF